MRILKGKAAEGYVRKLERRGSRLEEVEPAVRMIVQGVRKNGDRALRKYATRFDGLAPAESLRIRESELRKAWKSAASPLKSSLQIAAKNIRQFCDWQKPTEWVRSAHGISLGQMVRPLDSVGCYVPGGRFPLVSTLLMTVIPAQVAGVKNIRVVSPRPSDEVLTAAAMLGVNEFYRVGGAQAIAALAYGTKTIPRVDKIVGPGNLYVTAAKKIVSFDCAIDMLAGPTEVVIVSLRGNARFIASDLVAQAEHDPETLGVFITTSEKLGNEVATAFKKDFCWRLFGPSGRRLCIWPQSRFADRRRGALSWRIERAGFRQAHHGAGNIVSGPFAPCSRHCATCGDRGSARTR